MKITTSLIILFNVLFYASVSAQYLDPDDFASLGTFSEGVSSTIYIDVVNMTMHDGFETVYYTGVMDASGSLVVFTFDSFYLYGGTIIIENDQFNNPGVALLSKGNMIISGNIYNNASEYKPGAGGWPGAEVDYDLGGWDGGGDGGGDGGNWDTHGGAGGGFGADGGDAGYDSNEPDYRHYGGEAYVPLNISLQGGSGGGSSNNGVQYEDWGGGGGGALELGTKGTLTLNSGCNIEANGADGTNGAYNDNHDGNGGGSGGGILIHANEVTINSGSNIEASGGNGGDSDTDGYAGGGGGGAGRIRIAYKTSGTNNGTLTAIGGSGGQSSGTNMVNGEDGSDFTPVFVQDDTVPVQLFSGGDGWPENPYQIATTDDLIALSNLDTKWDKYFIQTADISFNSDETLVDWDGDGNLEHSSGGDDSYGFSPIGNFTTMFTGDYDGQNNTIDNLFIERPSTHYIGLFGAIDGASLSNLSVTNVHITGDQDIGGLFGYCKWDGDNSSIENSYTTGEVTGESYIGGLGGVVSNAVINKCYSLVNVGAVGEYSGKAGGFAGHLYVNATIINSYSMGNVTRISGPSSMYGGFAGLINDGTIENCYATGVVYQSEGVQWSSTGGKGFVGYDVSGTYNNNFFDSDASGQNTGTGATALTTTQMQDYNTFTDVTNTTVGLTAAWDFVGNYNDDAADNDYWDMDQYETVNGGYPVLSWQDGADELLYLPFSVGNGSSAEPFQISSTEDLILLSTLDAVWDKYFIQTADISFDSDETQVDWDGDGTLEHGTNEDDSYGFSPIGNLNTEFTGNYNGQGYTINNLYIYRPPNTDYIGFFGFINGASIANLGVTNVEFTGPIVGGLLGYSSNAASSLENCYTTGIVTGDFSVGGFFGQVSNATINECYSLVNVFALNFAGGFSGKSFTSAIIRNCYSMGDVTRIQGGGTNFAGFDGYNSGTIENCYSTGKVYESDGVIWSSDDRGFVSNTSGGTYNNNFFDSEASQQSTGSGATAKTTAEMKDYNTFTDETTTGLTTAWDFVTNPNDDEANNDYWDMDQNETVNGGYPILSWQDGADNILVQIFSGGSGTSGDPYQIANTDDLIELSNTSEHWGAYFIQTADISFNSDETQVDWDGDGTLEHGTGGDDSYGFSPIGNSTTKFTGSYNGQNYTISNLFINRASTDDIGLFGLLSGAAMTDINLAAVNITGNTGVGGLAGQDEYGTTISGCTINGSSTINGVSNVGGFIGNSNTYGNISNCNFSGTVSADNADATNSVGGFVGAKGGIGTISECSTSGTVNGNGRNQGGFVGWMNYGKIRRCYSTMAVDNVSNTQGRIGGFVGGLAYYLSTSGQIYNCYATGNVTANSTTNNSGLTYGIGGFVGSYYAANNNKIYNSYSTGTVSADADESGYVGGFSGEDFAGGDGAIDCFWDTETSGQSTSAEGETGKTTAEMKDFNTFTDENTTGLTTAWDFVTNPNDDAANNDYWDMDQYETVNSGYPILSWQDGADNKLYLFSGGDGTYGDPYQIATTDDLIELSNVPAVWDKFFIQTANISFNSDETQVDWDGDGTLEHGTGEDDSYGFSPIGNGSPNFTGDYDGQNYTVNNLYIDRPSKSNVGLFGIIHESSISNLGVTNVQITGNSDVGGLFGNGNLSLTTTSSIENCFTTGTVIGFATAGGFGGRILNSTVNNCYSLVNVTSVHGAGSFAGDIDYPTTTVSNSYSMGDVIRSSGTNAGFGGFAGTNSATIENCYATGVVYESTGVQWSSGDKGFVGINYSGTYNNNFFDSDASGQTSGTGATAKTTAEMKTESTFTNWNFTAGTGDWEIQGGEYMSYPYLQAITYDDPGSTPEVNPIPGLELVPYSGGSGTSGAPYQIATTDDLIELSNTSADWDKYFIQTANISFDSDETQVDWDGDGTLEHGTGGDDSYGFSPIGNNTTKFTGSFDGQSYTTTNLFISRASTDDIGLFGFLSGAAITDLNLSAVVYTGNTGVGGLAGQDEGVTVISGCTISGNTTIDGVTNVGGFIGNSNTSGSISDCNFSGTVSADNADAANSVGGFVGAKGGTGTISECSTSGTVNGNGRNHGGFVGWMNNGEIRRCYSTMAIVNTGTTQGRIGGFVGGHAYFNGTSGPIYNCYATGSVTANSTSNTSSYGIGGFVGSYYAADNNKIYNSYSTGAVSATNASSNVGGFSGEQYTGSGGANNCFWDTEASNQASSFEMGDGETGKTTAEMKTESTFTDAGWDFIDETTNGSNNFWGINPTDNSGYPFLAWQGYTHGTPGLWNGTTDTDWATGTNWDNGNVPVSTTDVTIPAGLTNYPTLSATGSCNNLTIETNAALTIAEGKALTINGDLVNEGTFTVNSSASGTGSLIVHGTSSGDISFERYVTGDHWHYISAPVSGQAINDTWMDNNSIVNTPDYQFFRYDEDQAYWIIYTSTGNPEHFTDVAFGAGKGYTVTSSADGDLMFYGPLNTSAVNFEATYTTNGARGMNLSGNPFSSTIAITEEAQADDNFLADNAGILDDSYQAIYIWQESSNYSYGDNDYKVICNTGFTGEGSSAQLPEDFVQPGQAFMVKVKQTGNIVYNPNIRVHGTADFYKSKTSWPGVELQIEGNGQFNSTIIAFNENMTSGLNPSFDVVKMKGNPNLSIYSALVEDNGNDYAVQALSNQNIEDYIVPIGVDVAEPATFEFSVYQELLDNYNIVLEDRLNSTFTNLRWEHYSTSISESGTGRFYLHFKDATAIEENQIQGNDIVIYAANSVIYIRAAEHALLHNGAHHSNGTAQHAALTVTDITGRIVLRREISGSGLISIPVNLETGIYIVAVENGNKIKIEKVFIK